MESISQSVSAMSSVFLQRMAAFEQELKKNPSAATSTSGLPAEFNAFRTFIILALNTLQQQVSLLAQNIDAIEMRSRRKMLLIHGVSESAEKNEDTPQVVVQVVKDYLKLNVAASDIKRCHRMGRASHKPRPILCKFHDMSLRNNIWLGKTKLKGSGVTVSEFLTKSRHTVFMSARDRFGVGQCWTREGIVYVLDLKGVRHRVLTMEDLNNVEPKHSDQQQQASGLSELGVVQPIMAAGSRVQIAAPKSKRNAARKCN
ncbi:hypothetical protein HW555_000560 [Spodoptera exigua]|uniref:Uncharacterized protein n=1 Tax=Spodoptera exigua TaxID=7107 RepID=A0A835LGB5_SPOEX|nr:hypothetical protein HW555_000560 [Spodoptera exigua]